MNQNLYRQKIIRFLGAAIVLIFFSMLLYSPAEGNYFNDFYKGVEQFSGLPSEVNKLKEGIVKL